MALVGHAHVMSDNSRWRYVELSLTSHQVDVLVKRGDDESFTLVSWQLSLHNGRWLIDSMNVT